MKIFKQSIVKKPGKSYVSGLTTTNLGEPDQDTLLIQHLTYIEALKKCNVVVNELPPSEDFPDSTFVEDTAVLALEFAIISNPGAESRKDEIKEIDSIIRKIYNDVYYIKSPGTLDGGDVLQIGKQFYIGISDRTNKEGAKQFKDIVESFGYRSTIIQLEDFFHLKTGVSYIGNNTVVVAGEFIDHSAFSEYEKIIVPEEEKYAANCIRVNDFIIIPEGFPKTKEKLNDAKFKTLEVEMTEFQKHDGGLSCLSLRF